MAFRITQKQVDCIGCGACAAIAPSDWVLKGDKAELVGSKQEGELFVKEVENAGANQDAANACPVGCIKVEEKK